MSADDMANEIEAINRANWSPGITCGAPGLRIAIGLSKAPNTNPPSA